MVASAAEAGQALVGYDQATMAPDGARHPGDEHDHLGCQEKAHLVKYWGAGGWTPPETK